MIERLARMVGTPSVSGQEGPLAGLLSAELRALGLDVRRTGNNLYFEAVPGAGPALLFNSHLDTVPPCAGWQRPPHQATLEGDRL